MYFWIMLLINQLFIIHLVPRVWMSWFIVQEVYIQSVIDSLLFYMIEIHEACLFLFYFWRCCQPCSMTFVIFLKLVERIRDLECIHLRVHMWFTLTYVTIFGIGLCLCTPLVLCRDWILQLFILTSSGITFAWSSGEPIHWKGPLVCLCFGYRHKTTATLWKFPTRGTWVAKFCCCWWETECRVSVCQG